MHVRTSLSLLTNMQGIKLACVYLHKRFHLNAILILMSNMKQWIQVKCYGFVGTCTYIIKYMCWSWYTEVFIIMLIAIVLTPDLQAMAS